MTLDLPFPPSTNTAYANVRGRRVKTKKAREYATAVQEACMTQGQRKAWDSKSRLAVHISVCPPDKRRRDLANTEKLAVDAVFDWLNLDDSQIDDLKLIRHAVEKPGRLVMTITELA